MDDLSNLTDEELDKKLAGEVEESPEVSEPTEEVEVPEVEPEVEEEAEEKTPSEEPEKPSRRETLRIQQVLEKARQGAYYQPPQQNGMDYGQALQADPQVIQQLETDRQSATSQAYQQGMNQAETIGWRTALRLESPHVESKYTFLDKSDAENFNPAAANAMNTKYLRFVGYDPGDRNRGIPESVAYPDVSYSDFVEAEMEFADEIARHRVENTTKNIAKQAATTGIRPDGSSAKRLNLNKPPELMTDEELDAVIEQGIPTIKR